MYLFKQNKTEMYASKKNHMTLKYESKEIYTSEQ